MAPRNPSAHEPPPARSNHPESPPRPPGLGLALEGKAPALHELGSVDHGFMDDRVDRVAELRRRAFTYLLLSGVRFAYASTARVLVVKFVSSMSASADVLALASAEFDVGGVSPGKTITVKWRGKPRRSSSGHSS